jgi:hypothetical protein
VWTLFLESLFSDGNFGILYWVLAVALVLLFPRIRKAGLGGSAIALALIFAETAASALWLYPEFTLNHGTVHRSLLPVSAAASVWLAALLAAACYPPPAPAEAPRSRASRRSSKPG